MTALRDSRLKLSKSIVHLGMSWTTISCTRQYDTFQEKAMKYLCMVFSDEKKLEALSASESQVLDDESLAHDFESDRAYW